MLFERGTDLRQGPYAPRSNVAALARPWLPAAGLAAGLLALAFVSAGVEYFTLGREDRALTEWLTENCARRLGTSSLSACEAEVRRVLNAAGMPTSSDGASFLNALATVAEHNDPASRLRALGYRNREMSLELTTDGIPALDEFARRVERTERFEVRIQSANPVEDGVEGRVRLVEAAP